MRGNLVVGAGAIPGAGSIPACAGEPAWGTPRPAAHPVYPRVCGGTQRAIAAMRTGNGLSPRVRGNPAPPAQWPRWTMVYPRVCGGTPPTRPTTSVIMVYPRVCGGTPYGCSGRRPGSGLSPRVRGNRSSGRPCPAWWGSIPACAGEPRISAGQARRQRVYPRVCGGTGAVTMCRRCPTGLSPRVRGNLDLVRQVVAAHRSIPACAGEPRTGSALSATPPVYPRVCGGTWWKAYPAPRPPGLSPRVRGNPLPAATAAASFGSIPACAGEPRIYIGGNACRTVYPRVCGGTREQNQWPQNSRGLSPRVRGNQILAVVIGFNSGSIPACAGEPTSGGWHRLQYSVYPRVCGGTRLPPAGAPGMRGLSPRVRGNRPGGQRSAERRWSIPACAGEPSDAGRMTSQPSVYPRVCGGTLASGYDCPDCDGLSPRVRGNPVGLLSGLPIYRSIPACAGNRLSEGGIMTDQRSIPACAGEPQGPTRSPIYRRVYPRVCGGTLPSGVRRLPCRGLSPRVRGNPAISASDNPAAGSIPACAGEPLRAGKG